MSPEDLKAWRKERWLSQADLGVLLGIHEMTVRRWEQSKTGVPPFLQLALDRLDQLETWLPPRPHPYMPTAERRALARANRR